jgi:hypothetical protein
MVMSDKPAWVGSTLRARSTHGTATLATDVAWPAADKLTVRVRIDAAGSHHEAVYAWQVSPDSVARARTALAGLRAKRGNPKGVVALTLGDSKPTAVADPAEAQARDALVAAAHLEYSQALTAQRWSQALVARGDRARAIELARLGITALGEAYVSPDLDDDTEMKVIAADAAAEKGRHAEALGLLVGVLSSRLEEYAKLRAPLSAR